MPRVHSVSCSVTPTKGDGKRTEGGIGGGGNGWGHRGSEGEIPGPGRAGGGSAGLRGSCGCIGQSREGGVESRAPDTAPSPWESCSRAVALPPPAGRRGVPAAILLSLGFGRWWQPLTVRFCRQSREQIKGEGTELSGDSWRRAEPPSSSAEVPPGLERGTGLWSRWAAWGNGNYRIVEYLKLERAHKDHG